MPSDPLTSWQGVEPGAVIMCSVKLRSKKQGEADYWWPTFRVVTRRLSAAYMETMILRMNIDLEKDSRLVVLPDTDTVVTLLADHEIPQGVSAMLMKAIMQKIVIIEPD